LWEDDLLLGKSFEDDGHDLMGLTFDLVFSLLKGAIQCIPVFVVYNLMRGSVRFQAIRRLVD
jgi:hypothetical protein